MPVAAGGRVAKADHGVDGGVRSGGGGRGTAGGDDRRAALLDGFDEVALQPVVVGDDFGDRLAGDLGVGEIGILGGRVVAPDAEVGDLGVVRAGLLGELAFRAVLVEPGHREEAVLRHAVGVGGADQGVGVAGIADHQGADIGGGVAGDRLALAGEDLAVDAEQVAAFHPGLARDRADQQRPVGAAEAFVEVAGRDHFAEQRESAVVELHHHALERGHAGLDFDQAEVHRLVGAEERAGSDAEQEGIADLAGGAGHGDGDGSIHEVGTKRMVRGR